MRKIYFLILGLCLFNIKTFSQCAASITFSHDGLGNYTFNVADTLNVDSSTLYTWELNPGNIVLDSNNTTTQYNFIQNGSYDICLHLSDTFGVCSFDTCISINVNDAEYHKMLEQTNIWHYRGNIVPVLTNPVIGIRTDCGFGNYFNGQFTGGTVTIDSIEYKELNAFEYFAWPSNYCLMGYIREDTLERKIFYRVNADSAEVVLYDFSLTVGDSIYLDFRFGHSGSFFKTDTYVLSNIGFVEIAGGIRRRFILTPNTTTNIDTLTWIEGVGNLGDMVYLYTQDEPGWSFYTANCPGFPHNFNHFMICFEHDRKEYFDDCAYNNSVLYPMCIQVQDSCNFDGFCGGIDDMTSVAKIDIVPNPVSENLNIQVEVYNTDNFSFEIQNTNGQVLLPVVNYGKLKEGKNSISIEVSDLPNGIYLLGCRTSNALAFKRFVLIH